VTTLHWLRYSLFRKVVSAGWLLKAGDGVMNIRVMTFLLTVFWTLGRMYWLARLFIRIFQHTCSAYVGTNGWKQAEKDNAINGVRI
jgi:hypothetical protein